MTILILIFLFFVPSLYSMEGTFLESKFKKTKLELEQSHSVADIEFLNVVQTGQISLIYPYLLQANVNAQAPSTPDIELPLRGHSALSLATLSGNSAIASLLIGRGADVTQRYVHGKTLLHYAVHHALDIPCCVDDWKLPLASRLQLVELLIAQGVDVHVQENRYGYTVFHQCCENFGKKGNQSEIAHAVFEKILLSSFLSKRIIPELYIVIDEIDKLTSAKTQAGNTVGNLACNKQCEKTFGTSDVHHVNCAAYFLYNKHQFADNIYKLLVEAKKAHPRADEDSLN